MGASRSVGAAVVGALLALLIAARVASAQENRVEITVENGYRYIQSNGIPDHAAGRFPNRNNPNTIAPQEYAFRVPAEPLSSRRMSPVGFQPFGVAVNGVPFDPSAAEFWGGDPQSGWQYEAIGPAINLGLDQSNAHVQPNGAYHYHGVPWGLFHNLNTSYRMVLIGYGADGFPIYAINGHEKPNDARSRLAKVRSSYRLREGQRPDGPGGTFDGSFVEDYEYVNGAGDLDGCNGRVGVTPEFPDGTYHYFVTEEFPYVPRFYRGTPDISFERRGPPPGGPGGGRGRDGPGGPHGPPPPGDRPPGGGSPPPGAGFPLPPPPQ